jgi:hypothetical protein
MLHAIGYLRRLLSVFGRIKLHGMANEKQAEKSKSEETDGSSGSPGGPAGSTPEPVESQAREEGSEPAIPRIRFAGLSNWQALRASSEADDEAKHLVEETRAGLDERLLSILSAERLVVLAGLGTSRELERSVDMADLWREAQNISGFEKAAALRTCFTMT